MPVAAAALRVQKNVLADQPDDRPEPWRRFQFFEPHLHVIDRATHFNPSCSSVPGPSGANATAQPRIASR